MRVKRYIAYLLVLVNIFLLSGCWNYVEIDSQLFVAGAAIDMGENGYKYHMTVEIIKLGTSAQSETSTEKAESDGNTIFQCIRNLLSITAKKLYWGHSKVIIISEDVAKQGISPILDMILRDHEIRSTVSVVVAKSGKAKDILYTKALADPIICYDIDKLLMSSEGALANAKKKQVYELKNDFSEKGAGTVISALQLKSLPEIETYKLCGLAVLKEDKLLGFLNDEEARAFLFTIDDVGGGLFTTLVDAEKNEHVTVEIFDNKTKTTYSYKDEKLKITIKTDTTAGIAEIDNRVPFMKEKDMKSLEKQLQTELEDNIKSLIKRVQTEFNSDIFGFSKMIQEKDYKLWMKIKNDWENLFQEIEIEVNSTISIRGSGVTNEPVMTGEE